MCESTGFTLVRDCWSHGRNYPTGTARGFVRGVQRDAPIMPVRSAARVEGVEGSDPVPALSLAAAVVVLFAVSLTVMPSIWAGRHATLIVVSVLLLADAGVLADWLLPQAVRAAVGPAS